MDRNESFRDMCEEFAEVELALSKVDEITSKLRCASRAELQELVDRLGGKVGAALLNTDTTRNRVAIYRRPGERL